MFENMTYVIINLKKYNIYHLDIKPENILI